MHSVAAPASETRSLLCAHASMATDILACLV